MNLWMLCIGAFIMFLAMNFAYTAEYGRMSNHKHCDMSLENLKTLQQSNEAYYNYY